MQSGINAATFREKPASSNFLYEEVGCRYPPGCKGFHLGSNNFSFNRTRVLRHYCQECILLSKKVKVKAKFSLYRPGVAHRVGRGIAPLFHDSSTRRG